MDNKKFLSIAKKLGELIKNSIFENKTYIVGGAVRDFILNKDIKDIDIVVELESGGILLAKYLCDKYSNHNVTVFMNYGTCKFTLDKIDNLKDIDFEAVQTRKEWYTEGSRKPSAIALGTIYDDALRRDLTINALYLNVNTLEILDPLKKGKDDIGDNIIRVPSKNVNDTFSDDPLRMLRVIRFSTRLQWNIEKNTFKGILNNTTKINTISKERINDELNKILLCDNPSYGFRLMKNLCLIDKILPELYFTKDINDPNISSCNNLFDFTMNVLDNTPNILENRIAALLHQIGKVRTYHYNKIGNIIFKEPDIKSSAIAKHILIRLKYPNNIINNVCFIIENQSILELYCYGNNVEEISDKSVRKILNKLGDKLESVLCLIDSIDKSSKLNHYPYNKVASFRKKINGLKRRGENISGKIKMLLNGNDIMKMFNMKSGPLVKYYLDYEKELLLESPRLSKEDCIKLLEKKKRDITNISK